MQISGTDCVSVVTKAADEHDLLFSIFCFFALGGTRGDCGENGNAFDLHCAI